MSKTITSNILKMAEEFIEAIPPTLPTGLLSPIKNIENNVEVVEIPSTERFIYYNNITVKDIKDLMYRFEKIYSLAKDAVKNLSSMKRDVIFDSVTGLDSYLTSITDEVTDLNSLIGKR